MAKVGYSLEEGGAKRLELSYSGNFSNCMVRLDGNEIGAIADYADLRAGREFILPDGAVLHVQLTNHLIFPYLRVLRNGQILPSAQADAKKILAHVYKIIFLIGIINLVSGLVVALKLPTVILPVVDWVAISAGCIFLTLGFFVMRCSSTALLFAEGLFAIDTISAIFWHPQIAGWVFAVILIFRVIILLGIMQGYSAIQVLKINSALGEKTEQPDAV